MSENLRILDELGEELQQAANRTLSGGPPRRSPTRGAGGLAALALGVGTTLVVVLVALGTFHPRSHTPASSARGGPRGLIIDLTGRILVDNRPVVTVKTHPSQQPRTMSARDAEIHRFTTALTSAGLRPGIALSREVESRIQTFDLVHRGQFPGLTVGRGYSRNYPLHALAAQLFGTVGPATAAELGEPRFAGASIGTPVGQSGLEWYYDSSLRSGAILKLSLDAALQKVAQQALQHSIETNPPATSGAFMAMNPTNGQIYAMGSLPTFNPNNFSKPSSPSAYKQLNTPAYPLIDRAIQFAGPIGSTIKPITAIAALESREWSPVESYDDTGQYCERASLCRRNAGSIAYGVLNLVKAIKVSDQVFFYNLAALLNSQAPQGGALQKWARMFGIGEPTGIDIGGELPGTLPTPEWLARRNAEEQACDKKHHLPPGGCGIADGTNRRWSVGDNINLAVGQGDVQVTPLQLAVAYAAIANGGTIVRPHVGMDLQRATGTVLQRIDPSPVRHLNIAPQYLDTVRQGLRDAASQPGGTSTDVFGNFPEQVYGETGTAQYIGGQDYAWYAGYVPASATSKPIVVVVTVQKGGFGAAAAAPVARQILSQWLLRRPGAWIVGRSRTL